MKTTVDVPDAALRQATAVAASRGLTLEQFFAEALEDKLGQYGAGAAGRALESPWMAGFGALADLAQENRRVEEAIAAEFETLAPEDVA